MSKRPLQPIFQAFLVRPRHPGQKDEQTPLLEPGKPVEHELSGAQIDSYRLTVPAVSLQFLEKWLACGKQASEPSLSGDLETKPGLLLLWAQCGAYSGHWIAALWALLSDARWKVGLQRMRITVAL